MGAGPLHRGQPGGPRRRPEARREPRQVVLAWLLARSPRMLPIPGSGSPEHVAENVAAGLELSPDEVTAITKNA
ncbi:MAG TPA: aldo/keto reductase [Streptosporangiaceae bacterium]|nr:aldo/keto reductase [Streptosporangiaceae bacterium]